MRSTKDHTAGPPVRTPARGTMPPSSPKRAGNTGTPLRPAHNRRVCWLVGFGVGLSVLGLVSVYAWLLHDEPRRDLHGAVFPGTLPEGRIRYSFNDVLAATGHDQAIVEDLTCSGQQCLRAAGPVFRRCAEGTDACVPPWSPVAALPGAARAAPVGGYPSAVATTVRRLFENPATGCTSTGTSEFSVAGIELICIDPEAGVLLYRSFRY